MVKKIEYAIGIDLGGTKVAGGLVAEEGKILFKSNSLIGDRTGAQVSLLIQNLTLELIDKARSMGIELMGIGVSVPGIYFVDSGNVWAPNIKGWSDYPLLQDLEPIGETFNIPIKIESDRAAYILGETWLGSAKGCRNAIYLAIGTGIGAGILVDGKVLHGANDIAGAVGWMSLVDDYRSEYSNCGCFEYYASGEGLVRYAKELINASPNYTGLLTKGGIGNLNTRDIFTAYEQGDPIATKVIEKAIKLWGKATANLISTFNPEVIVFGGGVFGPAGRFLKEIEDEARLWAQPISMQKVRITVSSVGADAGLLGAAAIAFTQI